MPLYEYICQTCHQRVELLIRGEEPPICPECGGEKLAKELSVPAGHVSGSRGELPISQPLAHGGCGRPQCGTGMCQFD